MARTNSDGKKKNAVNYAESWRKKQQILEESKNKSAAPVKMTEQDKRFLAAATAVRASNPVTGTEQIANKTKQSIYTPGQSSVLKTSPDMMQTARFRVGLEGFRTDLLNGSIFDDPESASMIRSALGDDDEESIRKLTAELDKVLGINISTYDSQRARSGDWSVLDGLDEGGDQYKEYNRLLRLAGYDTAKGLFTDALPEQAQRAGSMDPKQGMMMAAAGDLGKLGQPVQTYQDLMDLQRDYTREEAEKDLGIISGYLDGYVSDYSAYEQAAQNLTKYFGGDWSLDAMKGKSASSVPILGQENHPWYNESLAKYDEETQLMRDKLPGQNYTFDDYLAYVSELEDQQRYQAEQQKFTNEWNARMEKWDAYWNSPEYAAFAVQRDKDAAANPYDSSWKNRYNAFKGAMRGDQNDETGFKYMTETELERYDYLSKEVGEKEAKAYLDDVQQDLYRRRQMDINSDIAAAADEHGAAMWVVARGANAYDSMFNAPKNIFRAVTGQEINPYDPSFDNTNYKQIVDSKNAQWLAENTDAELFGINLASAGYQAGSSLADSYMAALYGGNKLASPMLGANAFNATLQEGLQAGKSQLDAVIDAAVDGLIEVGTEKFSIDALLGNGTSALKHLGKNIITEPTEEIFGDVLRETWDAIRNGEDSEFNRRISELQYQGYTSEEALRQAWKERGRNVLETALVSALSGGMGGAAGAVNINATNKKMGKTIADNKSTERLLEIADTLDMPEDVRKLIADERAVLESSKPSEAAAEAPAAAVDAQKNVVEEFDESTVEEPVEAPAASDETTEQKPVEKSGKNKDKVATSSPARLGRIFREVWNRVDDQAKNVLADSFSASKMRQMIDEYSDLDRVQPDEPMKDQLAKVATKAVADAASLTEAEWKMLYSSKAATNAVREMSSAIIDKGERQKTASELAGMVSKGGNAAQAKQLELMTQLPEELTPDGRTLQQYAADYGNQSDIMLSTYESRQDAGKYAQQFRTAFNYGRDGRNVESILGESGLSYLTKDQIRTAYELGRDVRRETAAEQRKVNPTGVTVGNVDRSAITGMKLNQAQRASVSALSRLAKAVGFNLKVVASTANADGKYTDKNGSLDRKTRTLTIDINAGRVSTESANYAMMQTAGHELTHYIKQFADSDLYNEYQEFVLGHLSKKMGNETLDDRIRSTVSGNAKLGKTLTREQAIDEIVADASGDALMSLTEADIREMAQTKPSLLKTIGKYLERWFKSVKALIAKGYEGKTKGNVVAEQMMDVADELGRKWAALLKNAQANAMEADSNADSSRNTEAFYDSDEAILNQARPPYTDGTKLPMGEGFASDDGVSFSVREGADQTDSEAFRAWFKDSKIVNADGTPKVMYHGSPNTFSVFDIKKAKSSGLYGRGFYFTDSSEQSRVYGEQYAVYLSVQNPLSPGEQNVTRAQVRKFLEAVAENEDNYSIENYGTYDVDEILHNVYRKDAFAVIQDVSATAIGDMVEAVKLFNEVNGTAFDGIVVPTETVVFRPNQIKSATGNVGTFNPSNDDIRYSAREDNLTPSEYKRFTDKLGEIMQDKTAQFVRNRYGEYIFAIDRKLVYNNGNAEDPVIYHVLEIALDDETDIDTVRHVIFDAEEGEYSHEQARRIFEGLFGKKTVRGYDYILRRSNGRKDGRGKRSYGRGVQERSRTRVSEESVDYQIRDPYQLTDREILANTMESVARNKDELDILQRYKARVAEYGEYQKQLEEINSGIVRMKKDKASRDEILAEQNRAQILINKMDKLDKRLAERERSTAIKALAGRERERVRTEQQKSLRQRDVTQLTKRLDREKTRYAEMKSKYEQELTEQKQKVKDARAEKNESFARAKYRDEVEKAANKLRDMVTYQTSKHHVPEILRAPLADFLDALDFSSERMLKGGDETKADQTLKDAMDRMHNALANVRKAQATGAAESGWLDLPDGFVEEFDNLRLKIGTILGMTDRFDTPINRMDSETLHELAKAFRILHASISNMNRLIANAKYESARSAAGSTIEALAKLAKQKDYNTLMQKVGDFLDWKNTVPYYAFKRFGEGGKAIFEALMTGWDKLANNSAEIIDFTEKTYTTQEVREWEREIREVTLSNGDTVRMTTAQLMSLYCLAKREQAVGHLLGGGIRVGNIASKGNTVRQTANHKLTAADLKAVSGMLTQREREVADALQQYMVTKGAKWGNYVSMKRFGYNMFTEANYFPIKSDQNNLRQNGDVPEQGNDLYRLLNMSATKDLTKGANNAVVVDSIFDVFTSHMADMAKYNALGLEILDALKWVNYVEKTNNPDGTVDTLSVREKMESAYGEEARNYVMEFIKNLNGDTEGGREDKLVSKAVSNYKVAATAANLRVALLQITSMPRAAYVINPKYLVAGLAKWNAGGWKNSAKAQENVGIAKWKSMGFYDTNVSRNLREMIKHDESALDKTHDYGMKLAEWGDAWTMGVLYGAVEAELAAKGIREGHSDFKRQMNNRMREIIYQTQVVDSTMTRSHLMRQKGLMTAITSFMSEPTLTMNLINDALFDARMKARAGEGNWFPGVLKQTAKAFGVTGFGLAAAAVIEAIMTGFRDDDEFEEFQKKFMDALIGDYSDAETFGQKMSAFWTSSLGGNANLLANIPIVKQYLEAAQGSSVELSFGEWITNSVTGVGTLYKAIMEDGSLADYYRGVYQLVNGMSQFTGIAVSGAMRDLTAAYNTFVAEPAGWRRIQTYDNTEREAAQAIFDAENAGDTALAQRYRERFKLYGMDEKKFNDAMSKLAQEAYIGGEITEARASEVMKASGKSNRNTDKALTAADYEIATGLEHGDMKDDFVAGTISEAQAKEYLKKYNGMRDREIDEKLGEWKYEKDTGNTYSGMKDDFLDGVISKDQAIGYRVKYGGAERGDAEETVMKWQYEKDTGLVYSELKLDYEDGVITESQLRNALAKYGGKDPEKVEETVSNYDYQIATGRTTTAPKYWRIAYAFDTGKDADTLINEAFDEIMYGGEKTKSWKQARSQIASSLAAYYKKDYLAIKGTAKGAQMLERILDLYEKIGYSRSYQTKYIEENWTDD